ncbi:hypothetical protein PHLCEN_2v8065 [Hermanssonia centrifuga]|uniref:Uncharacterized protein n=1 Tax=Hermanssonia centrifuga TaxID=98765 RepID=A0A2R6NUP7_9APHY|nr:hypothetical protein PHLCEN_2v8065 [Hermanssonia centrifuga]
MDRIMGSAELEDGILDLDGRVPRADRLVTDSVLCTTMWADVRSVPVEVLSANRAAKSLTVWRWRADMMPDREMQLALPKGGREVLGTVFYLSRA